MPLQPIDLLLDDLGHLQRRLVWLATDAAAFSLYGMREQVRKAADDLLPLVTTLQEWHRQHRKETTL